jgi:hypothetical protein
MNKIDIEYNTDRDDIQYPEYGRTIQEMLRYARSIEERPKRQKTVDAIIAMMMQLNPNTTRNPDDYREKLWNHAFAIAGPGLDVSPPPGVTVRAEEDRPRAEPVDYPISAKRFRHYGNSIQALIAKAIEMPDGPKKEGFVEVIASYMKLAYKTWNKEHYVSDDVVKDDLEMLSDGQLSLHEGHSSLDVLAVSANKRDKELQRQQQQQRQRNKQQKNANRKGRNNYGGGGGNYRKRK